MTLMTSILLISCLPLLTLSAQTKVDIDDVSSPPMFGGKIKHVIAIMLENRSFDHMLGFLRSNRSDIDGCLPSLGLDCSNPVDPTDPDSKVVFVDDSAVYVQPGDPCHSTNCTTEQLYNIYGDNTVNYYPPPMKGFVHSYSQRDSSLHDSGAFIMECFNPSTLPILSTLAQEYALIDRWFSDLPGPTEPNRLFAFMGTSQGMAINDHRRLEEGFNGPNIFKMLDEYAPDDVVDSDTFSHSLKWKTYFEDAPTTGFLNYVRLHAEHGRPLELLYHDIRNGTLPLYSWVDPAYFDIDHLHKASDQHPDHDVTKGERVIKRIYETLRASDHWKDTLLVVYYDEHGGFFDHVPPPNCPSPDGLNSTVVQPPFAFKRLGLRVPAILVSPWIKKGTLGKRPSPNEPQYTHSSLIRTMREQFAPSSPPFTARDAWALPFDDLVNLDVMRKDCLVSLPDIPDSSYDDVDYVPGEQANNDYQISFARSTAMMCGRQSELEDQMQNQRSLGLFVRECSQEWLDSV